MMVVALVLRPWIMQMRRLSIKPRILADDLQVIGTGPNHLKLFEVAFDAAQISPRHKSGYALRFPRIHRIRWDKPAREADRIDAVAKLVGT